MLVEKFSGQFIKIQHRARTEIEPADNLAWASRCGSIPRPIDQYRARAAFSRGFIIIDRSVCASIPSAPDMRAGNLEPADFGSELKRQPEELSSSR